MNSLILPFDQLKSSDIALVGGKAANLGELVNAGILIPDGFCLTTLAYDKFLISYPNIENIYKQLNSIQGDDIEAVREVGHMIREELYTLEIPQDVKKEFRKYLAIYGNDSYSVRSSATAEDLPDASFAGQQSTYLNIAGCETLLDAIKKCWISLFTDRAILYRIQNNYPHNQVKLSVIIQKMIQSEKSGIIFTADSLTGDRKTIEIAASYGLGEALVSGLVNPDTYKVDKSSFEIINKQIPSKETSIVSNKEGGTLKQAISPNFKKSSVLKDFQIQELAKLAHKIENHYGSPQDIEWGSIDNTFYILQSRPITSLYPIKGLASPDNNTRIYFSFGHQQMMTEAMTPLSMSTFQCILPVKNSDDDYESTILRPSGGHLFIDVTQALRHPILRKAVFTVTSQFHELAPNKLRKAMDNPHFMKPHEINITLKHGKIFVSLFWKVMKALLFQNLDEFIPYVNQKRAIYWHQTKTRITESSKSKEKVTIIMTSFKSMIDTAFSWIPQFIASQLATKLLQRFTKSSTKKVDIEAVSLGLPGNDVTQMNLAIGDLADAARKSNDVLEAFNHLDQGSEQWFKRINQANDGEEFLKKWNTFLEEYGSRGPSENELRNPRWYEDPYPLLLIITGYLKKKPGNYIVQHKKTVAQRKKAVKNILKENSRGIFGWIKRPILKRLIYVIQETGGLREHHKFLLIQNTRIMKETLKDISLEFHKEGKIYNLDDIWFLSWPEILMLCDHSIDLNDTIAQRKQDFNRYKNLTPPLVITSDGHIPSTQHEKDNASDDSTLIGSPVSSGTIEGTIRVIFNPHTETLKPGEILVTKFTDPSWTPLFINAGGLILEVGGTLTHGSVVAREYGIPAVVGIPGVTNTLKTGQYVHIDGDKGIVSII